jgi:hypothetical protein
MKPTPQTSSTEITSRRLPVTDYNFRSTADSAHALVEAPKVRPARAFWKLSAEIFSSKITADDVRELGAFGVVAAISAWPIVVALHAITRMVRNY